MDKINKVSGVIIRDRKLLVLKKKGLDTFISPGGKPEKGETPEETLKRELMEELGVNIKKSTLLGTFKGESVFEGIPIESIAFLTEIEGEPTPQMEIEELQWIDKNYARKGVKIAPLLEKHIIPDMIKKDLL